MYDTDRTDIINFYDIITFYDVHSGEIFCMLSTTHAHALAGKRNVCQCESLAGQTLTRGGESLVRLPSGFGVAYSAAG